MLTVLDTLSQVKCPIDATVDVVKSLMVSIQEDMLDKAWGVEPDSRLSCQAVVADEDLVIEIPKYTINQVSENH